MLVWRKRSYGRIGLSGRRATIVIFPSIRKVAVLVGHGAHPGRIFASSGQPSELMLGCDLAKSHAAPSLARAGRAVTYQKQPSNSHGHEALSLSCTLCDGHMSSKHADDQCVACLQALRQRCLGHAWYAEPRRNLQSSVIRVGQDRCGRGGSACEAKPG